MAVDYKKTESDLRYVLFRRYFIVAVILSLVNSLSIRVPVLGLAVGIVEVILWICYLVRGKRESFMLLYFLFTATLIESNLFATGSRETIIYSFLSMPGLSYYHHFFILFLAYIWNGAGRGFSRIKIGIGSLSTKVAMIFPFYCLITLVTCIMDDNHIISYSGLFRFVIIDAYNTLWFCLVFALTWDCILRNKGYVIKLKSLVWGVLSGVTVAAVILVLLGYTYSPSAGATYIQCPLILFFSPALILFAEEKKYGWFFFSVGLVSIVLQLKYSVGIPGAWWITTALFITGFYVQMFRKLLKGRTRPWHCSIVVASILAFAIIISGLIMSAETGMSAESGNGFASYYVSYKFKTFISLFNLKGGVGEWMKLIGSSIGVRVESFVNIVLELLKKPFYLIFGKGFGGSVNRYWGSYNWNIYGATFPDVQINYGIYSSFHVGLFEILINMGMIGATIGYIFVRDCIRSIFRCDRWLLFGTVWTLIFLYFYHSMFICMVGLCVGYYQKINKVADIEGAGGYNG